MNPVLSSTFQSAHDYHFKLSDEKYNLVSFAEHH